MKRVIVGLMLFSLVFGLAACNRESSASLLEQARSAYELENWDNVIEYTNRIVQEYPKSDEIKAAKKLAADAEKRKEEEEHKEEIAALAEEINPIYVECVQYFMDHLKTPESLKIYGDIYVFTTDGGPNKGGSAVLSMKYDAHNGYGAYNGSEIVELWVMTAGSYAWIESDSDYYLDIRKALVGSTGSIRENEQGVELETINGEAMAQILGATYVG